MIRPELSLTCSDVDQIDAFFLQTTRSEYDQPEYIVQRRYTDFLWLRSKLEETCPTHIIPVSLFSGSFLFLCFK